MGVFCITRGGAGADADGGPPLAGADGLGGAKNLLW
jgi:hypothetical protein